MDTHRPRTESSLTRSFRAKSCVHPLQTCISPEETCMLGKDRYSPPNSHFPSSNFSKSRFPSSHFPHPTGRATHCAEKFRARSSRASNIRLCIFVIQGETCMLDNSLCLFLSLSLTLSLSLSLSIQPSRIHFPQSQLPHPIGPATHCTESSQARFSRSSHIKLCISVFPSFMEKHACLKRMYTALN